MERIVAFQGERGAYSEEALVQFFSDVRLGEASVLPCRTLPDVFEAINEGRATDGLIPIENSLAGSINESYDLLLKNDLKIYGEVMLPVNHCLLALGGERIEDIKRVYSHPQALAQCDVFLQKLAVETVAVYDTAGSARMVKEGRMRGAAAIASRRASDIYGLAVLAEGIQTQRDNFTRFYAIGRQEGTRGERNKTVLVFATEHRPGALYWCLGAFAYRQINMTKLESRPSRGRPWEYIFYLDVETHISDQVCQDAIAELKTKTIFTRVLGSFPAA
ncbi:MAG: prephenate dehydratase [Firmicutes bacterium]|nr:prephenate dehydratase [Bacillota bacterium]